MHGITTSKKTSPRGNRGNLNQHDQYRSAMNEKAMNIRIETSTISSHEFSSNAKQKQKVLQNVVTSYYVTPLLMFDVKYLQKYDTNIARLKDVISGF